MIIQHRQGSYSVACLAYEQALANLPADVVVVTDTNVASHWNTQPIESCATITLRPGEREKTLATFAALLEGLADAGASRSTTVVAIGGGVVGDLAGFAAAAYMRGVRWIQLPTTLLAMVDSSVGGKVGVDLAAGKNLAGAFHPPSAVWVALETLGTLPLREFVNGAAEVWKYGYILDAELLERLEGAPLALDTPDLQAIIERCIALKAGVVEADEHETTGERAILNFGHTVGHALEKVSGYEPLKHGEAIAIGMGVEAALGERIGVTPLGTARRVREGLASQGLPVSTEWLEHTEALLDAMSLDKKAKKGALAFSLLEGVGKCKLVPDVARADVLAALRG